MPLIGTDIAIEIELGSAFDGTEPSYNALMAFKGKAHKVERTDESKEIDVTGFLPTQRDRFGPVKSALTIDAFVPVAGLTFYDPNALTAEGENPTIVNHWVRVSTIENSALDRRHVWEGVATKWKWAAEDSKDQVESITVNLNPDRD